MILTTPGFDTVARFNELPGLWESNEAKNKRVTEETFKTLGELFVNYHVENVFGLTLLHIHFLLEKGEILLETGSLSDNQQKVISQPVKVDDLVSSVQGSNWRITPDNLYVPYEFRLENENKKVDFSSSEIQSFLNVFSRKLNELNLTDIFGICTIEKDNSLPGIENTEGRKNITVPLTDSVKPGDQIEAVWNFVPGLDNEGKKLVTRGCSRSCYSTLQGDHNAYHTRS
ncbi:18626_t:CDS:2 [Acaulospora morrowiae]|uniref:18626_t:CDS:1 n=1 Tax=Acaulospora morrowiae TaxID=94023 RepID=A0A9N9A9Z6_9GLOM|nr:18626_t:CDS:2 [Acaulospora morrowiae]